MQSAGRYIALFAKNREYFEKLQFNFVRLSLNMIKLAELHHKSALRLR